MSNSCSSSSPLPYFSSPSSSLLPPENLGNFSLSQSKKEDPENPDLLLSTPTPTHSSSLPISEDCPEDATFVPLHPANPLSSTATSEDPAAKSQTRGPSALFKDDRNSTLGPVIVISGGSGWNSLVNSTPPNTTHCLPVSDDGGSSSEIIRVLGGPSIGDLRSRLVRLIPLPSSETSPPNSSTSSSNQNSSSSFSVPQVPIPPSNYAVHQLLSYRLPSKGQTKVIKQEWLEILEGKHRLWKGIEPERKEVIRGFLVHFQSEVLRRSHRNFEFRGMSVGNAFLAASQKFFRSIQSAIFLFSVTTQMHLSSSKVLPIINTNHTATIAAELEDDEIVVGQCEISHPIRGQASGSSRPLAPRNESTSAGYFNSNEGSGNSSGIPGTPSSQIFDPFSNPSNYLSIPGGTDHSSHRNLSNKPLPSPSLLTVGNSGDGLDPEQEDDEDDEENDDGWNQNPHEENLEDGLQSLNAKASGKGKARGNVAFDKDFRGEQDQLGARIRRIFYVNAYRHEVFPRPNPEVITSLARSRTLIYSCGSLWTSIMPCLVLRGVATAIATSKNLKAKILLLNTMQDRETRGLDAVDFLKVITESLNRSDSPPIVDKNGDLINQSSKSLYQTKDFITHLIYFEEGEIEVDEARIKEMGIACIKAEASPDVVVGSNGKRKPPVFDEESVKKALESISRDIS